MIVVGAVTTLMVLWLARTTWLSGVDRGTVRALIPIVLLLGLAAVALRGFRWARACLVLWLGYLALRFGMSALLAIKMAPIAPVVLLAQAAGVAWGAWILFASADVEAFFAAAASRDRAPGSASRL